MKTFFFFFTCESHNPTELLWQQLLEIQTVRKWNTESMRKKSRDMAQVDELSKENEAQTAEGKRGRYLSKAH